LTLQKELETLKVESKKTMKKIKQDIEKLEGDLRLSKNLNKGLGVVAILQLVLILVLL
jgi:hypothetical protein